MRVRANTPPRDAITFPQLPGVDRLLSDGGYNDLLVGVFSFQKCSWCQRGSDADDALLQHTYPPASPRTSLFQPSFSFPGTPDNPRPTLSLSLNMPGIGNHVSRERHKLLSAPNHIGHA